MTAFSICLSAPPRSRASIFLDSRRCASMCTRRRHRLKKGGRWCVQIGAFKSGGEAEKLRDHLQKKYQTANVIEFTGPTGTLGTDSSRE